MKQNFWWARKLKAFQYTREFLPLFFINAFTVIFPILVFLILNDTKIPILHLFIILCCNLICFYINARKFLEIVPKIETEILRSRDEVVTEPSSQIHFPNALNHADQYFKMDISYNLLQKQAQLDALQSQINPHFLYNTLDSIRGLAYTEGAENTADMIEAMSAFFRYSIGGTNDLVELQQEIKSLDNYMHIQKYRFNNRYKVVKQIDSDSNDLLNYRLPKLTLQPLIENAIYHGLEKKTEGGEIILRIITTQSRLIISVIDNGVGMDDSTLRRLNEEFENESIAQLEKPNSETRGVALVNVNARIKLLFGNNFGLTAYSTIGIGTEFQITLPLVETK